MIIRETYGEDIADTEDDVSEDDDSYEDSFINDSDVEFFPPSPGPNKSGIRSAAMFFSYFSRNALFNS